MKTVRSMLFAMFMGVFPIAAAASDTVAGLAERNAAVIKDLHRRISLSLVTVAQDKAFETYFTTQDPWLRAESKQRIDEIALQVQSRFQVEEMCLIGADGAEISRIVGAMIAYDLSPDETGAIFFAPGFAQAGREVYLSPPYISPDVPKWVIGYATPIIVGGEARAILHYEHALSVYQKALGNQSPKDNAFVIAVTESGYVVFDSRRDIAIERHGESDSPADYFQRFDIGGLTLDGMLRRFGDGKAGEGEVLQDGRTSTVAYRRVGGWIIVAVQPQVVG